MHTQTPHLHDVWMCRVSRCFLAWIFSIMRISQVLIRRRRRRVNDRDGRGEKNRVSNSFSQMFCFFNVSIFDILDGEDKYCLDRQQISFSLSLVLFQQKKIDRWSSSTSRRRRSQRMREERERERKRERIAHWTSYISFLSFFLCSKGETKAHRGTLLYFFRYSR